MEDIYNHIHELAKFEFVFNDENEVPHRLRSYIKSLDEDRILVAPPVGHQGKVVPVRDNQKFKIIISTEDGVYSGDSYVLSKEISQTPGLWISYPHNSRHCQRREYIRVPLNVDFELIIYRDSARTIQESNRFVTRDISGRGISFISDSLLDGYYDISCKIFLPDGHQPIESSCEHIYSKQMPDSSKYINALAFIDIDEYSSERIIKEVFRYQLEQRKKQQ